MDIWGIPLSHLIFSSIAVFGAAIVRGFSGFGFSLLSITAITLIMPQSEIVPSIFLLEIAASLHLIPGIWREIHWRALVFLLIGCVIGTPVGVALLANVPAAPMTLAMSAFVIVTAAAMLRGFHLEKTPGPAATTATGAFSGVLNGAFGIGGPPVILFFFSTPGAAAIGRASVIAYFIGTDSMGLAWDAYHQLITRQTFLQAALWLIPLLLGVSLGAKSFRHVSEATFRRWVLRLLMLLALLSAGKAATALI
ncbi:MAG TPA: sulfite exporter TauE/SafE family protein [Dongiaceae bacterium]|nr:sulfite exporter TauE/SafE family protein [Dongiaceae bacterium]